MAQRQKLTILRGVLSGTHAAFHPGCESIEVLFNPSEYSISAQNSFGEASVVGLTQPVIQFGGGGSRSLQLELLADTYAYQQGADVRVGYIARFERLMEIDPGLRSPPPCKLMWGAGLGFVGLLESLESRYVMFLEEGTPVRARLSLRFNEYLRDPVARVTDALASRRSAAMEVGETLPQLAQRLAGSQRQWRRIAEANEIETPRQVAPGTTLRRGGNR